MDTVTRVTKTIYYDRFMMNPYVSVVGSGSFAAGAAAAGGMDGHSTNHIEAV
jgi:hypothetical protein